MSAIGKIQIIGLDIDNTVTRDGNYGANGDVAINKVTGAVSQKLNNSWGIVYYSLTTVIYNIWNLGLVLAEVIPIDSRFGINGDMAIDQDLGLIYQKVNGSWSQVYATP